jgi:hypothetical protein
MNAERKGFEPWAWAAFLLAAGTAGLVLLLGSRPGGRVAVLAYRWGPLSLGAASAALMLGGLIWSLRRRPVLQRRRAWPLALLAASLWFCSLPIAYHSSHEGKFSTTRFRLPFAGSARVHFGGERRATNPLLFDPSRRFGLSFAPGGPGPLAVVAPAAGKVVRLEEGRIGRKLVLVTGEQEFCVLDGLAPESVTVAPGEAVAAGDALGSAAGLFFLHLQDDPEPGSGEGIPLRIWSYRVDGRAVEAGVPIPPQVVEPQVVESGEAVPGTLDPAGRR